MANTDYEFRETGMWPFSMFPRAFFEVREPPKSETPVAKVFDPIALAFKTGGRLIKAGWPGLELMSEQFQWKVVDASDEAVVSLVEQWVGDHRHEIADEFARRLATYRVDELATRAMAEGIDAYRGERCLSTVRTLMPEIERFGRGVLLHDGTMPRNQKKAVEAIQDYLGSVPVSHFHPLESLTIFSFLKDNLFAACYSAADAQQLGPLPNRHAELHGLSSYGDLRGATVMLSMQDFLLHAVTAAAERNEANTGDAMVSTAT